MKLNEFLIQVFGSNRSQKEFDQLTEWKSEGELSARKLREMSALNNDAKDLKDYVDFDVESALLKTLDQLPDDKISAKPKYLYWLIPLIILILASSYFYISKSNQGSQTYFAESSIFENQLLDGTKYMLNKGAKLEVDQQSNTLVLGGEAFFDVVKQTQPLIIKTEAGEITVLGTSFNVISEENFTEVVMFSGLIEFETKKGEKLQIANNQRISVLDGTYQLSTISNNQVYKYWVDQTLIYNNTPITNVLTDLERLFDKDYTSLKEEHKELTVTAEFVSNSEAEIIQELSVITGLNL